jgi:hypothetical protein
MDRVFVEVGSADRRVAAHGWSAADEVCYAIHEQMRELIDRMLELKPSTLEGYQAMESARAAA